MPLVVDFDNPHLPANSALTGQYPSGVIDWGEKVWMVAPPEGKMSTFSLRTAQGVDHHAEFRFENPRMLVRMEIYNSSDKDVDVTVAAPEAREVTFSLKPGELRRMRTGWVDRVSAVRFDSAELSALRFDNIGYSLYLLGRVDR